MGPKKKKKAAVPNTRGFATTSIVKPKVDPEPAEANPETPTANAENSTTPTDASAPDNPPNTTDEIVTEWEETSTALPALPGVTDVNTMVRTATLKVDADLAKDQRRRKEISRDTTIPPLRLAYKLEADIQQYLTNFKSSETDGGYLLRNQFAAKVVGGSQLSLAQYCIAQEAAAETSLSRLYTTYLLLERVGFQQDDIVQAITATGGHKASSVLTWLCINVPLERLPTGFSEKLDIDHESTVNVVARQGTAREHTGRGEQPSVTETPDVATPPEPASKPIAQPDADLKSWILRNAAADSDSEEDDDSPEAQSKQLSKQHATLRLELDDLLASVSKAKTTKDMAAKGEANSAVQSVRKKLRTIEEDPFFNSADAGKVYLEMQSRRVVERQERREERGLERTEPVKVNEGEGQPAADGDSDGDMGLGLLDENESASASAPTAATTMYAVRNVSVGNWTGRTPKQLLQDFVSKNAKGAKISYHSLKDSGRGFRAGCKFAGGKGTKKVDGVTVEMSVEERVETKRDADEFVAMKALYSFAGELPLHRSLPPAFRDVWLEWIDSVKNAEEQAQRKVEEDRIKTVAALGEARDARIKEFRAHTKSADNGSSVQTEGRSTTQEQTKSLASLDFGELWQQRVASSTYNELLRQRKSLPVYAMRDNILDTVFSHQVVIISGETGSGKSTQIPQFILENAIASSARTDCNIICTQPRRISAVSIATRVAEEMGDRHVGGDGDLVGYAVRLESKISRTTRLTYCTTGVLLRRLESDGDLKGVSHIVVDEVHERSLDSDFLLLLLRRLIERRSDLRIILMSATAEAERFATYFGSSLNAGSVPCVSVPGKTFPVTAYFMEDAVEQTGYKLDHGSEYALKTTSRTRDGGTIAVAGKGGKLRHVRVQWEEDDPVFNAQDDEDEEYDADEAQSDLNNAESGFEPDAIPEIEYSSQTYRTISMSDPRKINLELVERLIRHIVAAADPKEGGSVLVFLPGLAEIRKLNDLLLVDEVKGRRGGGVSDTLVLPLHSLLNGAEQVKVFKPAPRGMRKVVLATNIAETGITIPDVVYVVDTVRAREVTYDERRNITRLAEVLISKANCKQRRGRAGRVRPGVCYHLVSRDLFDGLPDHRPPEMLRLPLEELCLQIKATTKAHGHSGALADVLALALDPPPVKHVTRAVTLLQQIQALDVTENLTRLGAKLAVLPVDARLGKMLLYAAALECLDPVLTIAASLSLGKSPFLRPFGREDEADRVRLTFKTDESDLLSIATAFTKWRAMHLRQVSLSTIRDFCDRHFLNSQNLMLMEEARTQLLRALLSGGSIRHETGTSDFQKVKTSQRGLVFTVLPESHNHNAESTPVVMAAITAGLYPNILLLDPPPPGQTVTNQMLHSPGKTDMVRVHKGSVLHGERLGAGWFVCHGIKGAEGAGGGVRKAKAVAWDLNRTFGGAVLGGGFE
ncbi:ATP-dependent RNA helicase dhx29, partial [Rhizophlyctis rosea]